MTAVDADAPGAEFSRAHRRDFPSDRSGGSGGRDGRDVPDALDPWDAGVISG
ncbi:hypothetical protein [Roseateles aquatilis]|uniref:hypothetical protein n=1 Tax=Roseateles aquatilis TaxID=431061 RepID=UPI0013036844|nr:hypothetical protein [Roseateles aquatilis]